MVENSGDNQTLGFGKIWLESTFRPATFFARPATERRGQALIFALIFGTIGSAGAAAVEVLFSGRGHDVVGAISGGLLYGVVSTLVSVYLGGALIHLLLRLLRGTKADMRATRECYCYSQGVLVFALLPLVGPLLAILWQLLVLAIGLSKTHDTGVIRASVATLAPWSLVLLAVALRFFGIEAFKIPAASMYPTLHVGDRILVNKSAYRSWLSTPLQSGAQLPQRGDVAVFEFPEKRNQAFIKRVIALPGDRLESLDGRPVINGQIAPHCYIGKVVQTPSQFGARDAEPAQHIYLEFLAGKAYLTAYNAKLSARSCKSNRDCDSPRQCRSGLCGLVQGPYEVLQDEAWVMGDNRDNSHDSRSWNGGRGAGVPTDHFKGRAAWIGPSLNADGGTSFERMGADINGAPDLSWAPSLSENLKRCLEKAPNTPP